MPISVFLGLPRVSMGALGGAPALRFAAASDRQVTRAFSVLASRARHGSLPAACMRRNGLAKRREQTTGMLTSGIFSARLLSSAAVRRAEQPASDNKPQKTERQPEELHESPYTLPNALTLVRIASCPFLAYTIVHGNYEAATAILVAGGFTDWLDGYLARKWNQKSVLGSILDPMADKTLMTTLVVCLTYQGLLPLPLAILIFGRDLALSLWAFYLRFISIPPPRTIKRYFDVSMPSAEVQPTQISKVNTALQLLLMGITTVSPLLTAFPAVATGLQALQWTVAGTTIWSGLSYVGTSGFKILKQPGRKPKA